MDKMKWKTYAFWIILCEAAGAVSGLLSKSGMEIYAATAVRPPLSPPAWLFPAVWVILFALMGIGAARIWMLEGSKRRSKALNLFIVQLIINFFWPLFFFNTAAFGFAFLWLVLLWILVLELIWNYWWLDRIAAWLQVPYFLWLCFAAYLNLMAAILN